MGPCVIYNELFLSALSGRLTMTNKLSQSIAVCAHPYLQLYTQPMLAHAVGQCRLLGMHEVSA